MMTSNDYGNNNVVTGEKITRKWQSPEAQDSFHNAMQYEMEMGIGLRDDRHRHNGLGSEYNPKLPSTAPSPSTKKSAPARRPREKMSIN